MTKIINYFKWLFSNIKAIFYPPRVITKEDVQEFKEVRLKDKKGSAKQLITPLIDRLEAYEIPDEKVTAVIDYTVEFFARNWKTMTYQRMERKIAEYFKLRPKTMKAVK